MHVSLSMKYVWLSLVFVIVMCFFWLQCDLTNQYDFMKAENQLLRLVSYIACMELEVTTVYTM